MHGLVFRDRTREVIRVVRMVEPAIKVIACLILRTRRLSRRSAVRHIVLAENLLVRVRCIRIRCIRHNDSEFLQFPLRLERIVLLDRSGCEGKGHFRQCSRHRVGNFVDPASEIISGLIARRTALSRRCCGLTRIVAVLDRLCCGRHIAALRIETHLIARQIVCVVKYNLTARCGRCEILDAALRR